MTQPPRRFNRAEAAAYIKTTYGIPCSAATLAKYACVAGCDGPVYRKFNKRYTIYDIKDLDAWAKRRLGKDHPDARTIHEDAGQVQEGRPLDEDRETESRPHLQRD